MVTAVMTLKDASPSISHEEVLQIAVKRREAKGKGEKERKSITVSIVYPSIFHEVMGLDAMIFVFEC